MKFIKNILNTRKKRLTVVTLFLFILGTVVARTLLITTQVAKADSLFSFNEGYGTTVNDNSGSASGTITNADWKTEDLCKSDKCLYFDGTSYIDYGDENTYDWAVGDSFTISFWFRHGPATSAEVIVQKYEGTGADGGYRIQMESDGDISFSADNDNSGFPTDSVTSTAANYDDNKWHYVSAVKNGTTSMQLYIDTRLVAENTSLSASTGTLANDDTFYVGDSNGTDDGDEFIGFLDELKIYTTTARTQAEVNADYAGTTADRGTAAVFGDKTDWLSDGLVGYWDFPEATGSATLDKSGNGNDGTLTNMQETGEADSSSTTTTIIDTNASLSSTNDAYNNMIVEITDGSCGITSGTSRTISDYDGGTNTITVSSAFGSEPDGCGYIIKHQVGGKFGNSIIFGGESGDDYVDIGNTPTIEGNSEATVCTWLNYEPASVTTDGTIISRYLDGQNGWLFWIDDSASVSGRSNTVSFSVDPGTLDGGRVEGSDNLVSSGEWDHYCGVFKGGSYIRLFKNGILDQEITESVVASVDSDNTNLYIGRISSGTPRYFEGNIDEARIYNRALSPAEVKALYEWAPGPAHHWSFDEGSGDTVYDRGSIGGVNGTLVNNPVWSNGKYGKAVDFNRVKDNNEYISLPNTELISINKPWTISMWIYGTGTTDNVDTPIAFTTPSTGGDGLLIVTSNMTGSWAPISFGSTSSNPYARLRDSATSTTADTLFKDKWNHLIYSYDGSDPGSAGSFKFYLNGVERTLTTSSSGWSDSTQNNFAAQDNGQNTWEFHGLMDEVKIYHHQLTQAQVIEDMNAGHPAPGSPVGSALGHWKFDEGYGDTAYDSGTGGNNANLGGSDSCPGGSACPDWTSAGKFNKALDFNNNTDITEVADSDEFTFSDGANDKPLTLSAWVNTSDGNGGEIISKSDVGAGSEYRFFIQFDSGSPYTQLTLTGGGTIARRSDTAITTGVWNHLVATYDGSGDESGIKLYINGNEVTTNSQGGGLYTTMSNTSVNLFIGARRNGASVVNPLASQIDDVRIYNSELTASQVKLLFNQSSSAVWGATSSDTSGTGSYSASAEYCPPGSTDTCTPPVAEWKFDEGSGTIANDTSENSNTGTLGGDGVGSDVPSWTDVTNAPRHSSGLGGKALEFDSSEEDFINVTDNGSLDMGTKDFTVTAWGKLATDRAESNPGILGKGGSDTQGGYRVFLANGDDMRVQMSDGTNSNFLQVTNVFTPDNRWHHFTVIVDREPTVDTMYVYVDGALVGTDSDNTIAGNSITDGNNLYIGDVNGLNSTNWTGGLDNVRIYDYARTPTQIAWEYNRGGPVGWWKMDDNVSGSGQSIVDHGTNGINGTTIDTGGSAIDCTVEGKKNTACHFDGSNDYIDMNDPSELELEMPFTISAWLNPDQLVSSTGSDADPISKYISSSNNNFTIQIQQSNDQLIFFKHDGTSGEYASGNNIFFDSNDVGNWKHITFTTDASGNHYWYEDGIQVGSGTFSSTNMNTTTGAEFFIGARNSGGGAGNYFDGKVDDVRIYNYALTPVQIKNIFNSGAVYFGP